MHFVLFHVEFQGGSSISVLKNRAAHHKKLQLEIEKFLKGSNVFNVRPPTVLLIG
jgi:transposase